MSHEGPATVQSSAGRASVLAACGWLALVVALSSPLLIWYGHAHGGATGMAAALVAAGICWLGATLALLATAFFSGPVHGVTGLLLGMIFRMGLPLAAGLMLGGANGPLAGTGLLGMIVTYYLVTLVTETLLAVRLVQPFPKAPKTA